MAEQQLQGLIATFDEYLVKKAPFQIPANWPVWASLDYGFTHPTAADRKSVV